MDFERALNLDLMHSDPSHGVNQIGLEMLVPVDEVGEVEVGGEEMNNGHEEQDEQNAPEPAEPPQLEAEEPAVVDVDADLHQQHEADSPIQERSAIVVDKVLEIEGFEDEQDEEEEFDQDAEANEAEAKDNQY